MAHRNETLTIPVLWIAIVLSLLVHVTALWLLLPHLRLMSQAPGVNDLAPLAVEIAPRREASSIAMASPRPRESALATPVSPPPALAAKPVPHAQPRPRPAPRVRPLPPMIARAVPQAPMLPPPPLAPTPAPATPETKPVPMPTAPASDLASYIEAKRMARGEAPSPPGNHGASDDIARRDRIVAENLGLGRQPAFGANTRNAGGLFEIREVESDAAEFYFFGFDKDIQRKARQLIEVRRGKNPDIRIAIVRKMIEIIRDNVSGDFLWTSQRLGRNVRLSARPEDNAGLEDFIMHDVFPDPRVP